MPGQQLPPGSVLNADTGVLSGRTTVAKTYAFAVKALCKEIAAAR